MATAHAGWRRHVATTHDEAALRGYGTWEATSGHRARQGKQRGKRQGLGASPTRTQDEAQPAAAPSLCVTLTTALSCV
jgi:hypothetical protein